MSSVNISSINSKIQSFINSGSGKQKVNDYIDKAMSGKTASNLNIHTPEEAAEKFIDCLNDSINSSALSYLAKEAVSGWEYGASKKNSTGSYTIVVSSGNNVHRDSLYPKGKNVRGADDIVILLNDGMTASNRVWGMWQGEWHGSLTTIPGAWFIEAAESSFKGNYGYDYNVVNIRRLDEI